MRARTNSAALALAILMPFAASSQETATTASAATTTTDTAGFGTVVFFREKKFLGAMNRYKVRENGVELCKLSSGTFCSLQVPAGKHVYVVHSEAKDVLTLEIEPGETYYVIGTLSIGIVSGRPNLSPSDKRTFRGMKPKLEDRTGQDLDSDDEEKEEQK